MNGKLVVMVEHQATINENMPFRFLQPIARIFENGIPDKKAIYRKALIRLPRPEFIVLYNGTTPFPDRETLRLSDAYEQVEGFDKINLELEVVVYNINEGCNTETVNRCEELKGYAYFVHRVRYHEAGERERGVVPGTDITRTAIEVNMLGSEWDLNTALEVEREEGFEKGLEKGLEKAAQNALAEGVSVELVSKITMLDIDKVRELSYT